MTFQLNALDEVNMRVTGQQSNGAAGLKECVQVSLKQYFDIMGDDDPEGMYRLVMDQVEPALLKEVLDRCKGNQSRAAKILGLNRTTLRKKLQQFGML